MKQLLIIIQIGVLLIPLHLNSQSLTTIQPQKRVAIVIGNGNYQNSILANPENDARAMKTALQNVGFTVYEYENLNQSQMKKAIDDFGIQLKGNSVGLFYYAGHGIQSNGYNYLIPVDAQLLTERQVEYDCVQADRVLAIMEGSGTAVNIIILDACRNNPFERSWTRSSTGRGLAFMNAPSGTLIAYSTAPGNTAQDGSGNNSPYTSAILESLRVSGLSIAQLFQNVTRLVSQKSGKQQIPWISSSLTDDFYFDRIDNNIVSDDKETINFDKLVDNDSTNKVNLNLLRFDKNLNPYIDGVQTSYEEGIKYMKENDFESFKIYRKNQATTTTGLVIAITGGTAMVVGGVALISNNKETSLKIIATSGVVAYIGGIVIGRKGVIKQEKWLIEYNSPKTSYLKLGYINHGLGFTFNF